MKRFFKRAVRALILLWAVFFLTAFVYDWVGDHFGRGGLSPYGRVNNLPDQNGISAVLDWEEEGTVLTVQLSNASPEDVIAVLDGAHVKNAHWALEQKRMGIWHSLNPKAEAEPWPVWMLVIPAGEARSIVCDFNRFYTLPLEPGEYRLVLPQCQQAGSPGVHTLAMKFEVT